jgi:hypothetical protein
VFRVAASDCSAAAPQLLDSTFRTAAKPKNLRSARAVAANAACLHDIADRAGQACVLQQRIQDKDRELADLRANPVPKDFEEMVTVNGEVTDLVASTPHRVPPRRLPRHLLLSALSAGFG